MIGKGRGAGDASSQLKALIAREKVAERVKIIPHVPYEELLDWTVSADIGLITYEPDHSLNFQMCLPNKLFEFLMAGVPVLTSPLDAVIDVVKTHHVGKILPSLDPADIGAAINTMLADPVPLRACTVMRWTQPSTNSTGKRRVLNLFVSTMKYSLEHV